jgi:putative membrane-bound dehydrogenase-like protein
VLITADLCGVPAAFTEKLAKRLQPAGVQRDRFTLAVTHSHTTPMVTGYLPTLFGVPIPPEHRQHIDRYTAELLDKLERVAKDALADRRPARLSWGVGTVGLAKNRRTAGVPSDAGSRPTDHDLPVLAVRDLDGKLRAVWASYACHCVTLSNNKISGDWAGFAKETIEADNSGAIALVSIGCGADQNPNSGVTGDKVEVATVQGREVAAEVKRVLGNFMSPIDGPIAARAEQIELPLADLPARSVWEEKAKLADPKQYAIAFHAKTQLARLDRGEPLATKVDYTVRAWTFGDGLALVFLPGEVVVDYGLRLKKELDGPRIWINAYSNDVPCYIPSERVLKEGGYEAGGAMIYYDLPGPFKPGLEQRIVDAVHSAVGRQFRARFDPAKTNGRPLSPQQSLAAMRLRPGLTAELMATEPLVASPVAIAFGPDGRLWVAEMYDYPSGMDGKYRPGGRIRVLSHEGEPGASAPGASPGADAPGSPGQYYNKSTVFLDNIPFPTGVTVWRHGILVCAAPDILYAEDTRGAGKADVVKKLYSGFGTDNYQARVNSLEYGLDGWVYGSCGLFGGMITSFTGKKLELGNRDFRIKPDTGEIEPATGRTQQGRVRDDWDNWFGCDNTHLAWHYPLPDHYVRRNPHAAPPDPAVNIPSGEDPTRLYPAGDLQLFKLSGPPGRPTAVCGLGVYRDDLLGKAVTGDLFVCEPVNLLVHRMKLTPRGSTFAGVRAPGEERSEFLASTDPWFRPVQVRTGPDGCLWVVDMHRYVIEHPRWIPPEDLAKLDVRAGATLGRIIRIRPADREPRPILRLDKLDNAGLVAALDSPNGCQRDLAMQMLLWRNAKDAVPALAKMAAECKRPEAKVHALCSLDGLGKLPEDVASSALNDPNPGVRRHAVRLAERFQPENGTAGLRIGKFAEDRDAQVRLQVACTLGHWPTGTMLEIAARMAARHPEDAILVAAVTSDYRCWGDSRWGLWTEMIRAAEKNPMAARRLPQLLTMAVTMDERSAVKNSVEQLVRGDSLTAWKFVALSALLDAVESKDKVAAYSSDAEFVARLRHAAVRAHKTAFDDTAPTGERVAALGLLGRDAILGDDRRDADLRILTGLLSARQPADVQAAAAIALVRMAQTDALLGGWPSYSPALKSQSLDLLLARRGGANLLLDAIERNMIPGSQIDAARRQRLLSDKDAAVRQRAAKLFAAAVNPDRQKVVAAYQDVLRLPADAGRGKAVFAKSCSACHKLGGVGHEVGPDLAQLQNKSPAYLLQEVLDPNRNVDSRYVEYRATTKAGRVITGVLHAESATSVTLRAQEGKDEVLLRGEIDTLESAGRSLMPEGFEKDLSRQDLADLFAYLSRPSSP